MKLGGRKAVGDLGAQLIPSADIRGGGPLIQLPMGRHCALAVNRRALAS